MRLWRLSSNSQHESELALKLRYSSALGVQVTAVATVGDTVYAGAIDGRIWISFDGGRTWPPPSRREGNGPVQDLFVDVSEPRIALAALGGSSVHMVRTTNFGNFWDDLTANLPDVPAYAVTSDRASGAIYVATDRGVFSAYADLDNPANTAPRWTSVTGRLPSGPGFGCNSRSGGKSALRSPGGVWSLCRAGSAQEPRSAISKRCRFQFPSRGSRIAGQRHWGSGEFCQGRRSEFSCAGCFRCGVADPGAL